MTAYGATGRTLKEKLVLRDTAGQALVSVQLCERKKGPPTIDQRLRGRYLAELVSAAEYAVDAIEALADPESPLDAATKTALQSIIAAALAARKQWRDHGNEKVEDTHES